MSGHSKAQMTRALPNRLVLPINQAHQLVDRLSWSEDRTYLGGGWGITVDCPVGYWVVWLSDDNLAKYEQIKDELDEPLSLLDALR